LKLFDESWLQTIKEKYGSTSRYTMPYIAKLALDPLLADERNKLEKYASFIGNFIWLIAMIFSVFLPLQLDTIWFLIGLSIFIIGLIFITIATSNFITTPMDQLIAKGVYKISRHPMYLATFFICLGSGIATMSLLFIFLSIVMALCFYQEALIEERYCLNRYGNVYQEYRKRTPRLI